jgi:hypothetical protein
VSGTGCRRTGAVSGESLGGLAGLPVAPERQLEDAVPDRFAAAGPGDLVVLTEVTAFEWDVVGVFGPYFPHEDVVERMEVRVPQGDEQPARRRAVPAGVPPRGPHGRVDRRRA